MSDQDFYRSFRPDLQVRSSGDGRTICGIAVPYNAPTRIDDQLIEQFARGAFNHQLNAPHRVKFAREHVMLGGTLIGAASLLRDDSAGLYVELRASKTPLGDETIELVRDGALTDLSVYFRGRQNRRLAGGITERVTADLREVASVVEGAYGELATVSGVRSATGRPGRLSDEDIELRAAAEQYLQGLPPLPDRDLEIRLARLGMPL
jgi:Escherichia/Staphylococcus phage prohead protease